MQQDGNDGPSQQNLPNKGTNDQPGAPLPQHQIPIWLEQCFNANFMNMLCCDGQTYEAQFVPAGLQLDYPTMKYVNVEGCNPGT